MNKTLITIVGPTGIGKTALSIAFAKAYNTAIISCDSRQFYKEMTIGTAVPTEEELQAAPHYFIQDRSIHEPFSVGDFEKEVIGLLNLLFKSHDILIMVGGSALFEKAITHGLDEFPEVNENIKNEVELLYEKHGLEWLQTELNQLDPAYYKTVDLNNHRRLIRAVSFVKATGIPFSAQRSEAAKPRPFKVLKIGLQADRPELYNLINLRVDAMIDAGLLDEVKALEPFKQLNALQTVGYKEFYEAPRTQTITQTVELVKQHSRQFAKRQMTWYRRDETVKWFNYKTPHTAIIETVHGVL